MSENLEKDIKDNKKEGVKEEEVKQKNNSRKKIGIVLLSAILLGGVGLAMKDLSTTQKPSTATVSKKTALSIAPEKMKRADWDKKEKVSIIYSDETYISTNTETIKESQLPAEGPVKVYENEETFAFLIGIAEREGFLPVLNGTAVDGKGDAYIGLTWEKVDSEIKVPETSLLIVDKDASLAEGDKKVTIKSVTVVEVD